MTRISLARRAGIGLVTLATAGAVALVSAPTASAAVTLDQAAQTVIARVPGATLDNLYIYQEYDDGRQEFDGELVKDNVEYDFEILASTGEVRWWTVENYTTDPNPAGLLSQAQAADIVLARVAGATTGNLRIYLDRDDRVNTYEGTIIKDFVKYEFEVNASTGAVREWDVDQMRSIPGTATAQPTAAPTTQVPTQAPTARPSTQPTQPSVVQPTTNKPLPTAAPTSTAPVTQPTYNPVPDNSDASELSRIFNEILNLLQRIFSSILGWWR
ncbi:MAG: PepSY domain-containing protein [Propionibacteriaceae bacterium]|jgi:uncharacterized membrane protein YkoI|nr:PepSY domain-containing protein [Propionibacteriaceae bacterium]